MIAEMSLLNFQLTLTLSKICPSLLLCVGGTEDKIRSTKMTVTAHFHSRLYLAQGWNSFEGTPLNDGRDPWERGFQLLHV